MSPEEKYLFDLHGYLVVQEALSADLLGRLNGAIDYLESLGDEEVKELGARRNYVDEDNVYAQTGVQPENWLGDYSFPPLS